MAIKQTRRTTGKERQVLYNTVIKVVSFMKEEVKLFRPTLHDISPDFIIFVPHTKVRSYILWHKLHPFLKGQETTHRKLW